MSNITSLSIDLAKNTFQLHGTDRAGKATLKKKLNRAKLPEFMAKLPHCEVYMEGCGSANFWGRKFKEYGHEVRLINPRYVKPYVKRNKNDRNDAAAIAAAARDPDMVFGEVKTEDQQDMQSIHRIRSLLIQQRTALANQVRGLLAEYGIIIPKGISHVKSRLADVLGNNPYNMNLLMMQAFTEIYNRFNYIDKQVKHYSNMLEDLCKNSEVCQRLIKIPGVGELGSTILSSILGNGGCFKNGRHFAAFLGLTPREHSSGNNKKILGISKSGDTYIRTILIHGARTVVSWANTKKKIDKQSLWLRRLSANDGTNRASVALANKTARIAWAVIKGGVKYNPNHKHKIAKTKKSAEVINKTKTANETKMIVA